MLRPGDLAVLELIRLAAVNKQPCPNNEQIMRLLGAKSVSAAPTCLERLQLAGELRITRAGRNGRTLSAPDGSWSVDNAHMEFIKKREQMESEGPRQTAEPRQGVLPAPAVWPPLEAPPRTPATGMAGGASEGRGAADAGAPPAALHLPEAHVAIADLRAQVEAATVRARGGPARKGCQWPLWPASCRPRVPMENDPAQFGPPLFCGAEIEQLGRPYCAEHRRLSRRRYDEGDGEE